MREVVLLAFTAALNPTLLTATTVMLLLRDPARLMLGYWLGAMTTSVTLGLIIVFALQDSSAVSTTRHTLNPAADLALGAIALLVAFVLATDRAPRKSKADKGPPRWQRTLSRGTARTTFVLGVMLTLPGVSYLAALTRLSKLDYDPAVTVVVVIGFNLVMLGLLEAPMVAFAVAPDATPKRVKRFRDWVARHGRRFAVWGLTAIGSALILKGIIGLL
jgi:hypothetical protein